MDVGGGRRLTLAPEAMWLETRGGGQTWIRIRAMPYAEIQAVYAYDLRDWAALGWAALGWMVASGLFFILYMTIGGLPALAGWSVPLLLAAVAVSLAAYRIASVPRKMLRVDTLTGSLIVRRSHPRFLVTVGEHLAALRARQASVSPPPGFITPPPPGAFDPPPPAFGAPPGMPPPGPPAMPPRPPA
jgi:hypothetical protein